MFQRLVSHNSDLERLVSKGYAVAIDINGYLIVRDIPYLDQKLNLCMGALVTKFVLINEDEVRQQDHQVFFAGGVPYELSGIPIPNLNNRSATLSLGEKSNDIVVERQFSNVPKQHRFVDFFAKIESYTAIISGPAIERFNATPFTFRYVPDEEEDPIFLYCDTLTSRAEIADISHKLDDDIIAIIGLGGTGSYVLDFLSRTRIKKIKLFDRDEFFVHNAYRSPGRLIKDDLGMKKADMYHSRYSSFRNGIEFFEKNIDATCEDDLIDVTFAFVCVDKGSSRAEIFDLLFQMEIPFIDVGMGLNRIGNSTLDGQIRTSYFSTDTAQKQLVMRQVPLTDNPDDIYKTNIQISELNALNACFAVVRYKQLRGFYNTVSAVNHTLFSISIMKLLSDDTKEM